MAKKDFYEFGDILCDMHDGFRYLPDNLEMVSTIRMKMDDPRSVVTKMNRGVNPGNKYLVIVGFDPSYSNMVAVYYYDNTTFGMVELKYK